jgi:Bacterial dnaA protein helix-turn-helix
MTHEIESAADLRAHYAALQKRNRERDRMALLKSRVVPKFEVRNDDVKAAHEELEKQQTAHLSIAEILDAVSASTIHSVAEIRSWSRKRSICKARQVAIWLSHYAAIKGFTHIGRYFDVDHSTVIFSVRKIDDNRHVFNPLIKDVCVRLGITPPVGVYALQHKKFGGLLWTAEDDRALKQMYESGKGPKEIAAVLLRTAGAVSTRLTDKIRRGQIARRS